MAAELQPCCHHEALPGCIHRHIGWVLDNLETLEVDPHRVSGIGQMTRGEGVGGKQMAVLVIPVRQRNSEQGN